MHQQWFKWEVSHPNTTFWRALKSSWCFRGGFLVLVGDGSVHLHRTFTQHQSPVLKGQRTHNGKPQKKKQNDQHQEPKQK